MTLEKQKRLIASATAMAVVLAVILIIVMIYQMITINVKNQELKRLNLEIQRLEEQRDELDQGIERWQTEWKIIERARELGYVYKNDK